MFRINKSIPIFFHNHNHNTSPPGESEPMIAMRVPVKAWVPPASLKASKLDSKIKFDPENLLSQSKTIVEPKEETLSSPMSSYDDSDGDSVSVSPNDQPLKASDIRRSLFLNKLSESKMLFDTPKINPDSDSKQSSQSLLSLESLKESTKKIQLPDFLWQGTRKKASASNLLLLPDEKSSNIPSFFDPTTLVPSVYQSELNLETIMSQDDKELRANIDPVSGEIGGYVGHNPIIGGEWSTTKGKCTDF